MNPIRPRWYVVRSKPRREELARDGLIAQGLEAFLPMIEQSLRHAGRTYTANVPLFPRYLFLRAGHIAWGPVMNTRGVSIVLCNADGSPRPIQDGVIERIMRDQQEAGGAIRPTPKIGTTFVPGQRLKIIDGPFAGLDGLYQARDEDRVKMLIDFFGRMTQISASLDGVRAVAASPPALAEAVQSPSNSKRS